MLDVLYIHGEDSLMLTHSVEYAGCPRLRGQTELPVNSHRPKLLEVGIDGVHSTLSFYKDLCVSSDSRSCFLDQVLGSSSSFSLWDSSSDLIFLPPSPKRMSPFVFPFHKYGYSSTNHILFGSRSYSWLCEMCLTDIFIGKSLHQVRVSISKPNLLALISQSDQ